jgi:hypothetical protein
MGPAQLYFSLMCLGRPDIAAWALLAVVAGPPVLAFLVGDGVSAEIALAVVALVSRTTKRHPWMTLRAAGLGGTAVVEALGVNAAALAVPHF